MFNILKDKKGYDFLRKQISFFIPESFNTNISQELFDYIITFVNPQH